MVLTAWSSKSLSIVISAAFLLLYSDFCGEYQDCCVIHESLQGWHSNVHHQGLLDSQTGDKAKTNKIGDIVQHIAIPTSKCIQSVLYFSVENLNLNPLK
ncbi:hypothetical protein PoB_001372400 [Plakobranchus ocellatus]|uniref:Secreted protein n=1 Tax=Plakobranchus ocellatus TaxID=259542 RepID=A0AAV3YZL5_9GAST|nr:hypothetical protein PoB_001372400 [Plakobranchus ocellatus]